MDWIRIRVFKAEDPVTLTFLNQTYAVCPRSIGPFNIVLYKMGQDFLDKE